MDTNSSAPSRWYYGLAGLILVIGIGIFAFFLYTSIRDMADPLIQVAIPGEQELTLSEPGKYTIFHEYRSTFGGVIHFSESLSGLQCALLSKDSEEEIELSSPSGSTRYSFGGREGYAILEFRIDTPGEYHFSAWFPEEQKEKKAILAIGHGFVKKLVGTIFTSIAILFGSIGLAIAITVITAIKREKCGAKKR